MCCSNTDNKVPVLFVPGFVGSKKKTSGGIIYPRLPTKPPQWNNTDNDSLILHDPFEVVGWTTLRKSFEAQGYEYNCTLFEVPYDWSLSIGDIMINYLMPWIHHARITSLQTKVDIIAHSMGGLVTRAYIQDMYYPHDVQRFAMVGTPNKGATTTYYTWEGGDILTSDTTKDDTNLISGYFYTQTLHSLYQDRTGNSACEFTFYNKPTHCAVTALREFFHSNVTSLKQLMPTYDNALIHDGANVTIIKWENTLLKALNNIPCKNSLGCVDSSDKPYFFSPPENIMTDDESGVQTKLFIGTNQPNTVQSVFVTPPFYDDTRILYQDGLPQNNLVTYNNGDGTVLVDSAKLNDLPYVLKDTKHGKLIKEFATELVEFIVGSERSSEEIEL